MEAQMYLPSYMREVAKSGNLNHNQHANYVELLADFAEKRDKEFYALRNECNELKKIAFHLGEDKLRLLAVNKKLACAIGLIRETLNGGEVQDLHQIINAALAEHAEVAMMTAAHNVGIGHA